MSISKKTVVITGASQGIGAGLVQEFLKRDYNIVASARSIEPVEDPRVQVVRGDIADPQTADRIFETAMKRFGRVDTVINNAGQFLSKPFTEYTAAEFHQLVAVNLAGFFHVSQRAVAIMEAAGSGHIINITTTLADQPSTDVPAMLAALTKGGLNSATKSLATEYASRGIRVNSVSPGVIKTPMHPVEAHAQLAGLHPMGRLGDIDEIVHAIVFLEEAEFVTGEILHVDGGQHAGR